MIARAIQIVQINANNCVIKNRDGGGNNINSDNNTVKNSDARCARCGRDRTLHHGLRGPKCHDREMERHRNDHAMFND